MNIVTVYFINKQGLKINCKVDVPDPAISDLFTATQSVIVWDAFSGNVWVNGIACATHVPIKFSIQKHIREFYVVLRSCTRLNYLKEETNE